MDLKKYRWETFFVSHTFLFMAVVLVTMIVNAVFKIVIMVASSLVGIISLLAYLAALAYLSNYYVQSLKNSMLKYGLFPRLSSRDYHPVSQHATEDDREQFFLVGLLLIVLAIMFTAMMLYDVKEDIEKALQALLDLVYNIAWFGFLIFFWRKSRDCLNAWLRKKGYMPEPLIKPFSSSANQ